MGRRMFDRGLIQVDRIPDGLLSNLENRDVALWIGNLPKEDASRKEFVSFCGMPWALILSETYDAALIEALQRASSFDDPMTRKRGFLQIIDSDPSRIELPQRCLPYYLLNGKAGGPPSADFESRLRRMTMLEALRRSGVRELLIVSDSEDPLPPELKDLWSSGFRVHLTFITSSPSADDAISGWMKSASGAHVVTRIAIPLARAVAEIIARYEATYPEERRVLRVRDAKGNVSSVDITEADEPERPITEWYSFIEERDLHVLTPVELSDDEFVSFFRDPTSSWRPYAAGLPWVRDDQSKKRLRELIKKLDTDGPDENCIGYISAESGAGGTTLAHALAWELAREGYPVLMAKQLPFVPDALPVVNFLNRVHNTIALAESGSESKRSQENGTVTRRYEVPWLVVFDSLHWQYRDSELVRFRNEMEKAGRPVCLLVVTGPELGLSFLNRSIFTKLTDLNHAVELSC
jgi:hypothetical protein